MAILLLPSAIYPPLTEAELAAEDLSTKDRIDAENARYELQGGFRLALVQAIGGLIAISGAVLAWLQYRSQRANRRDDTQASLFADALVGLRGDTVETRVGALYLLARLADMSEAHRRACAEVMLAFIRRNRPWPPPRQGTPASAEPPPIPVDIQVALSLLVRHPSSWYERLDGFPLADLDLRQADLTSARLEKSDLRRTRLDCACLHEAELKGANLTGANLYRAILTGARLEGARLDGTQMAEAETARWVIAGALFRDVGWPDRLQGDSDAVAAGALRLSDDASVVNSEGSQN
ncbi:pentapeptide repeat-containing protein [Georgenia sp. 10Sc9-8]|uniref:Pentapeptide repeat-containing protein n=1 Tax=Georgenia halotolerans TaxID=3028317 RepID=A0ABT5TYQ5_9MICO|nr:pentapeptide repeat-containing protein [Georgenia halotolerans]